MRIQKIEITDFRGLSNVTIDNLDKNLNLLMGVNGAGKSSILDSIALLLTAFTSRLSTATSKGTPIAANDIKRDSHRGCMMSIFLDNGVMWSKFRTRKMEKKEESDFTALNEYTKPIRQQLDEEKIVCVPIVVHYGVRRSVTDIPLKFPNAEDTRPTACYKDWLDSKASYRDIFPWLRAEEDYENELIRDNAEARDRGLEALRAAMRIIFPEYSDLRVRRKPHQEVVLKKEKEELPLSQLSDGEKCYIALVCDIVRRLSLANPVGNILQGEGIVLIDEVDLHLHPSWEATVMEKLHEVFPNIQFIVSAHSPLVASHFDGQVYGVRNGEVTPLPRLFGLNYSTILQDWMMSDSENKEMKILADLYKMYKEYNMQNQAEVVWSKILKLTKGDVSSPYFLNLKSE